MEAANAKNALHHDHDEPCPLPAGTTENFLAHHATELQLECVAILHPSSFAAAEEARFGPVVADSVPVPAESFELGLGGGCGCVGLSVGLDALLLLVRKWVQLPLVCEQVQQPCRLPVSWICILLVAWHLS